MTHRIPLLRARRMARALEIAGFDASAVGLVLFGLVVVVLVELFADGVGDLLGALAVFLAVDTAWLVPLATVLKLLPLAVLLVWAYLRARGADARAVPVVAERKGPATCRTLVLFLSRPGRDVTLVEELCCEGAACDLREDALRRRFDGPWRMSVEAIAHHLPTLGRVVVVPSCDAVAPDGRVEPGTARDAARFCALVRAMLAGHHEWIVVEDLATATGAASLAGGVSYERLDETIGALNLLVSRLAETEGGRAASDIRIDITSGTKTASAAATGFALALDVPIQYVNTNDYSVWGFELGFGPRDPTPAP